MRAVDLYWSGQEAALSPWLDKKCPTVYDISESMASMWVKTGANRDGVGWDVGKLRTVEKEVAFFAAWKVSMETGIMADEAANRATEAVKKLKDVSDAFRANTKNDITSMKAASERVQREVLEMSGQYKAAMVLLNSPEFMAAVEQAERMAKALESIAALSETKLSIGIFSGGPAKPA